MSGRPVLSETMRTRLNIDEIKNLISDFGYEDRDIETRSEGVRYLIDRSGETGNMQNLILRLSAMRDDVSWIDAYNEQQSNEDTGGYKLVLSLVNNNTKKILQVEERVINLEESFEFDELKMVVLGKRELNVRPIRADVQLNRILNLIQMVVMLIGFTVLGILIYVN